MSLLVVRILLDRGLLCFCGLCMVMKAAYVYRISERGDYFVAIATDKSPEI